MNQSPTYYFFLGVLAGISNPSSSLVIESGATPQRYKASHSPSPANAAKDQPPGAKNARSVQAARKH